MSTSSHKVGRMSGRGLIEHADQAYTDQAGGWTTLDLADFVAGILEAAVESLAELRPECVREITESEAMTMRQMDLRYPAD